MKKYILFIITAFILLSFAACAEESGSLEPSESLTQSENNGLSAQNEQYENISGWASNQFAVWIEDMNGNYINTLYATRWTANGGWQSRPDSIALWVEKSDLPSKIRTQIDAIAGATPRTGPLSYSWYLTDADGNTVQPGGYKFFVEGTLRWRNYVIYSGVITIGNEPITVIADVEFVYEASDGQDALTGDSLENAMIWKVTASFTPAAN